MRITREKKTQARHADRGKENTTTTHLRFDSDSLLTVRSLSAMGLFNQRLGYKITQEKHYATPSVLAESPPIFIYALPGYFKRRR